MKTALLFVVALIALLAAGCGSSGTSSGSGPTTAATATTTATTPSPASPANHPSSYLQRFQAVDNRFEQSPQIEDLSQALATATEGPEDLAAEAPLQAYIHRLDTYIAELRGLHFPACARHFQRQIVKFESEGRAGVAKILPLLRGGDATKVAAYVRQAAPELSEKLGQVETEEDSLKNGGNEGC